MYVKWKKGKGMEKRYVEERKSFRIFLEEKEGTQKKWETIKAFLCYAPHIKYMQKLYGKDWILK